MAIRVGFAFAVVVFAAGAANAQIETTDPYIYGQGRNYHQISPPVHYQAVGSFFDIFFDLEMHGPPIYAPPPGVFHVDGVPGMASMRISLNGLPPGEPVLGTLHMNIGSSGQDGVNIQTEMLAMDIFGGGLPPGMMIRESPTLASTGQTSIQAIPGNPSNFRISSFFDVFTELSIDGGQSWIPSSNGPARVILPTPGASVLLALGGLIATRRRRG